MDPVRGFGYAPPLWAARSASNRRTCSSGVTEPGVVSCRRIASLTALVAAADFSASEGSRRCWFGFSFTRRCRISSAFFLRETNHVSALAVASVLIRGTDRGRARILTPQRQTLLGAVRSVVRREEVLSWSAAAD